MTITKERLAEIKARCEAATEGPWEQEDCRENHIATATGMDIAHAPKQINAQFIAHARTDVPALLTEVERLRGLIKTAEWYESNERHGVEVYCNHCDGCPRDGHWDECPAFTHTGEVK